jgi:hypothetical protein
VSDSFTVDLILWGEGCQTPLDLIPWDLVLWLILDPCKWVKKLHKGSPQAFRACQCPEMGRYLKTVLK